MSAPRKGAFRALASFNYRLWAGGALVSNIGTWMQRIAQDWLVLTQLTAHNATAVGVVMALQFGPQLVLLPWTGWAADHLNRRRLVFATQSAMGLLALGLGLLTLSGRVRLWEVDLFALLQGCAAAFDAPARQTFVAEMVGEEALASAVSLNSTSFHASRMIGPAIAGGLIAVVGSGWLFVLNAVSFAAVLGALGLLRKGELHPSHRAKKAPGSFTEGFRYVWRRADLRAVFFMLLLIGTFGFNFPIFISTMSVRVFHGGAGQYGLLTTCMAIGSVTGALLAAWRETPRFQVLLVGAGLFGLGCLLAALMPTYGLFGLTLTFVGIAAQTVTTSMNSLVQLSTAPAMRGRVIAILLALVLGSTPFGAPIVGWVADHWGPRWALGIGAAAGFAGAAVGAVHLIKERRAHFALKREEAAADGEGMTTFTLRR